MKRTDRTCNLCEHLTRPSNEYPCKGCVDDGERPSFVEKKAQSKLEYIRMRYDLLEKNVKELEKLAFGE